LHCKMNQQLPKDWKWVKLGEACQIIMGQSPPSSSYNADKRGLPFFQGKAEFSDIHPIVEKWCNAPNKIAEPYDVLLSVRAPVGATNIANLKCCIGRGLAAIRFENYKYVFYFLRRIQQELDSKGTGTTFRAISGETIRETLFPLPPKQIQTTIVSKIEELFSELDKGIEQLKTAQQQLKTYRQSVLKWAFEGRLTNENVKEGELPEGWKVIRLGEHIEDITAGKSLRCEERPPRQDEVGIVKVSSVTWGYFDEMESKTCFSRDLLIPKFVIRKGDFLFSRANTIELVGACVVVNNIDLTLMLSDKILRFTFSKDVSKKYVLYYLRSRLGRRQIERLSTGNQESMRNIGQEKIRQIQFPYCSIEEQHKIVQEIETRVSVADKMEESITQSLQQAKALRQSILKKAFRGNLAN
jgi:type I restriction enzyme S subunit